MGPLNGFKIVEIAGIGPSQLCGMLLADMGAQIIRVERPDITDLGIAMPAKYNLMNRSRATLAVDLKTPPGVDLILRLCDDADAIFEGYRPSVMEKLGLGPTECMSGNPRLVYGRITGWGQDGPLSDSVGHDPNYIAVAGALGSLGDKDRPPPVPLNLIGDFGGGALYLAVGMLAAMLNASRTGQGQVVDAAMVDGVASMMTMYYGLLAGGMWKDSRQSNVLDGTAPYVRNYETKDHRYIAVCALEKRFFASLLNAMKITDIDPAAQNDKNCWPEHLAIFTHRFKQKTRDEWADILEGTDSCAAPILSLNEAPQHAHSEARSSYTTVDGIRQPVPAPRFSRTPSEIHHPPTEPGERDVEALSAWGFSEAEICSLQEHGVLHSQSPS